MIALSPDNVLLAGIAHLKDYAIQIINIDGHIESCNQGTEYLTQYSEIEILKKSITLFFGLEFQITPLLEATCQQGSSHQQTWLLRKDGSSFWANITLTVIPATQKFILVLQDYTLQNQQALQQKEQIDRYYYSIEGAEVGIWDRDLQNDTVYWNSRYYEIFGLTKEEKNCFATIFCRIHPDDRQRMAARLQALIDHDEPYEMEYRIIRSSGEMGYCFSRGKAIRDEHGKAIRLVGALLDITQLKLAQQEIKYLHEQLEKRFSATFQQAAVGFAHVGLNSKWFHVNAKLCEIFGYSESELCSLTYQEMTYPPDLGEDLENVTKILAGEITNYAMHKRFIRKDGSIVWTNLTVSLVRDNQNNPEYFISVIEDITQRKNAEFKLQQTFQQLQTNEARLSCIINSNIAGIFFWETKQVTITDANDNFLNMLGFSSEEFIDNKLNRQKITPPEFYEQDKQNLQEIFHKGFVNNYEKQYYRKGGQKINVLLNFTLLNDWQGVAFVQDITERKRAEQALLESEQRFRKLAEDAPIMLWMTDQEGRSIYANRAWLEFTGENYENYIGKLGYELNCFHPDDKDAIKQESLHCIKHQIPHKNQKRYQRFDGEYRWVSITANPRFTITGEFIGHVGICLDVTENKVARDNLTQFTKELEKRVHERTLEIEAVNKELEAFSYSVSHDLRAPLRSIDGFSNIIATRYAALLDEQGKEYFQYIRENTKRMSRLIDDLLLLSKVSRAELKLEDINLSDMAEEITKYIQMQTPHRNAQFLITPNIIAKGDPRLIHIALDNLLRNAWKFTSKVTHAQIEFSMQEEENHTIYIIKDNGAGFDMKFANKLFGAFQRLHSISEFPGTGIGLATVQRIIHRHQGGIWATGETAKGASFFFTLESSI